MPYGDSDRLGELGAGRIHFTPVHPDVIAPRRRPLPHRRGNPSVPLPVSRVTPRQGAAALADAPTFGLSSLFSKAIKKVSSVAKGVMASSTGTGKSVTKAVQITSAAAGHPLTTSQAAQAGFGISQKEFNIGRSIGQAATVAGAVALTAGAAVLAAPLIGGAAAAGGAAAPAAAGGGITGITGTVTAATGAASAVGAAVKPIRKAVGAKPITAANVLPSIRPSSSPAAAPAAPIIIQAPAAAAPVAAATPEPGPAAAPVEAGILDGIPWWGKALIVGGVTLGAVSVIGSGKGGKR